MQLRNWTLEHSQQSKLAFAPWTLYHKFGQKPPWKPLRGPGGGACIPLPRVTVTVGLSVRAWQNRCESEKAR
jgi:hypothetical protein